MIEKIFPQILTKTALLESIEKQELARITSLLPEFSTIVEVGTFMGGSAVIMSSSLPTAQIHCFDLFEDDPFKSYRGPRQYKLFDALVGIKNAERSLENVKKILKDYTNIHLYKKRSPFDIVFDMPIDLYFEDSIHNNPSLERNLNFWPPKLKKGGVYYYA